ncbi:23702_t:CDS:1, partial [Gigaspora margarita]
DQDFVKIVKTYLASVRKKEIRSQQIDNSETDKENTLPSIVLRNPKKVIARGRLKLSSYRNNQQSYLANELLFDSKRKHEQNYCSYCKGIGHNIATCFKKVED